MEGAVFKSQETPSSLITLGELETEANGGKVDLGNFPRHYRYLGKIGLELLMIESYFLEGHWETIVSFFLRTEPLLKYQTTGLMRQITLFVTSRAAWRWNKMLLARENVDSPLAAMVVATEHEAL